MSKGPRGFVLLDCTTLQFDKTRRQKPIGGGVLKSKTREVKKREKGFTTKESLKTPKQTQATSASAELRCHCQIVVLPSDQYRRPVLLKLAKAPFSAWVFRKICCTEIMTLITSYDRLLITGKQLQKFNEYMNLHVSHSSEIFLD